MNLDSPRSPSKVDSLRPLPAEGGPRVASAGFRRVPPTTSRFGEASAVLPQGSLCFPLPQGVLFPRFQGRWQESVAGSKAGSQMPAKPTRAPRGPCGLGQHGVNIMRFARSNNGPHPGRSRYVIPGRSRLSKTRKAFTFNHKNPRLLSVLDHQGEQASTKVAATSSKAVVGAIQRAQARGDRPKTKLPPTSNCYQP